MYYIDICERKNLSRRQLQERIKNHEYDRLSDETKNKLIIKEQLKVNDLIPNPIIIKANTLNKELSEYALKQLILNDLDDFLNQLGARFTYVGNEYKIKVGNTIITLIYSYIILNINVT